VGTQNSSSQIGPKTAFGKYMVYKFIPQYANNVFGLVYMGAAILIIIVGLRGLGRVAGEIAIVPRFLLGPDGKIDPSIVMMALFLEFGLLLIMAIVTFFTPEEDMNTGERKTGMVEGSKGTHRIIVEAATFKAELEHLQNMTNEELRILESYVDKLGENAKRLNVAKAEFFKALSEIKQYIKIN